METFHKGFTSPLLIALIAVLLIGGGAYVYVQNKQASQPVAATSTAQTQINNVITITSPVAGSVLPADQKLTIRWIISSAVLDSFPKDFKLGLFLNIQRQGEVGTFIGINDGMNDPRAGSVLWDIPAYISSGALKSGTYKIVAYLQAMPKDQSRMCVSGNKECVPSEADTTVMQRSTQVKGESSWFSIVSSGSARDNNTSVIGVQISNSQSTSWETYINSQYGFQLNYISGTKLPDHMYGPNDNAIRFQPIGAKENAPGSFIINVMPASAGEYPKCSSQAKAGQSTPFIDVTINGIDFTRYDSFVNINNIHWINYCTIKGGYVYLIGFVPSGNTDVTADPVLNRVISSFKFNP